MKLLIVVLSSLLAVHVTSIDAQTQRGDLRLVPGGSSPNGFSAGRLEIYINGVWGTVCNRPSLFGSTEANVACKQLGYNQYSIYGTVFSLGYPLADASVPFWLDGNIDCHFTDSNLLDCEHDTIGTGVSFCTHSDDIALNCSTCDRFLCNDGTCVTACDGTRDCPDGEDENQITCALIGGLSQIIKIVIAVVVVVIVLCVAVPVISCIVACFCCGVACFKKNSRTTTTTSSTYEPMGPVHEFHDNV